MLVCLVFYCIGTAGGKVLPNVFCIWTALKYVIFFWLGFELRKEDFSVVYRIPTWLWILGYTLCFAFCEAFAESEVLLIRILVKCAALLGGVAGAIMAFVTLQKLSAHIRFRDSRMFAFFQKRSMPMYLFHQPVIYFTIVWLNGRVDPYMHSIINFVAALCFSLSVSSALLCTKLTRMLIGEK